MDAGGRPDGDALLAGAGPVFAYEWLTASRRWQGYALRSLLVLLLLLGLSGVWWGSHHGAGELSVQQVAEIGRGFYTVTTLMVLGLVGLVAPAAAAGAICLDKARGNLTLLFSTDLTDAEIVLGKLAARLVPVLGLIACAAPVQALTTLLGGVDPTISTGAMLVCLACAAFGCTLALTLSVWGRKTHEVLLATYAFGILYLLAAPMWAALVPMLPRWALAWLPGYLALLPYNPVFLASPRTVPRRVWARSGWGRRPGSARWGSWPRRCWPPHRPGGSGGWSSGRPARGRRRVGRIARPPPAEARPPDSPACCQHRRSTATRCSGASGTGGGRRAVGRCLGPLRYALEWVQPLGDRRCARWRRAARRDTGGVISGLQVSAGLLLLSVSAVTSLAEERQRGSLDVLLSTPLSTRSIVLSKWLGAFRGVPPLTVLPMLIAAALATHTGFALGPVLIGGLVVAYGAVITSLGLALATWLPRMGRAIGLTAGLYIVVLIGAIPVGTMLFGKGPSGARDGVASASPFWGVGFSSALFGGTTGPGHEIERQAAWLVFWIVAYGLVAIGLLLATLRTFNRCLGRIDNWLPAEEEQTRIARLV